MNADIESEDFGFNENGAIVSTSNMTMENSNATMDEENASINEESIDIKPMVNHYGLRDRNSIRRNRKFNKKKNQASKARKHPNAKRFKCDQCDYTNAYESRVKEHKQKHNAEKKFQCEECNGRFTYIGTLRTHLKNIHNIIVL